MACILVATAWFVQRRVPYLDRDLQMRQLQGPSTGSWPAAACGAAPSFSGTRARKEHSTSIARTEPVAIKSTQHASRGHNIESDFDGSFSEKEQKKKRTQVAPFYKTHRRKIQRKTASYTLENTVTLAHFGCLKQTCTLGRHASFYRV